MVVGAVPRRLPVRRSPGRGVPRRRHRDRRGRHRAAAGRRAAALGECKRSGAGLRTGDIDKLEAIADRIGAAWTFYATPDWAAICPPIWQDLRRDLPDRRRFALTGEQLLSPSDSLVQLMGQDLTAFNPWDDAAIDAHAEAFSLKLVPMLDRLERPPGLHDWMLLARDGQD